MLFRDTNRSIRTCYDREQRWHRTRLLKRWRTMADRCLPLHKLPWDLQFTHETSQCDYENDIPHYKVTPHPYSAAEKYWALLRASLRSLRTTSMPPLAHFLALDIQIFLGRQAGGYATMATSCHNCLPQQRLSHAPRFLNVNFLGISTVTPHCVPKPHNFKLCKPLDMDTWTSPLHVL